MVDILSGIAATIAHLTSLAVIVLNGVVSFFFLLRKHPNRRADFFHALLLLSFAGTTLHQLLLHNGFFSKTPAWRFLPVYGTLSFGTFLFYAVKLRIFPGYRFVRSDVKHFLLPVGQFLYFAGLFWGTSADYRADVGRSLLSPFYGGLEMLLYIGTFYAYQFGAYRYIHFKVAVLQKKEPGETERLYSLLILRRMLRVMLVLFWMNSAYIAGDFLLEQWMGIDLYNRRWFRYLGALSFALLGGWVGVSSVQLLYPPSYVNFSSLVVRWLKGMVNSKLPNTLP
ncbi:MAG: hypothetical protein RLY31_1843 [Bacteroidota bacterium]|jgi:hypothetical protein